MNFTPELDILITSTEPYNISQFYNNNINNVSTGGSGSLFDENGETILDGSLRSLLSDPDSADLSIFDRPYVRITFIFLYSVVFCFCFFGNLTVVLVVTLHWGMRSVTKFCLANLAFANLCVGIFCVYQNLSTFLIDTWVFGRLLCKMYHFTNSLSHTASILILVVICVERYMAILHPFKFRQILTITRLRFFAHQDFIITTYEIPVPAGPDGGVRYDVICAPQRTLYDSHIVDMINFVLLFLVPLGVISFLYTRVGVVVWRGSSILRRSIVARESNLVEQVGPKVPNNSFNSDYYSAVGSSSGATTSGSGHSSSRSKGSIKRFWRSYKVRKFTRRYLRPRFRRRPRYSSPADSPVKHDEGNFFQSEIDHKPTSDHLKVSTESERSNNSKRNGRITKKSTVEGRIDNYNFNKENRHAHSFEFNSELPSRKRSVRAQNNISNFNRAGSIKADTLLRAVAKSPRLRSPRRLSLGEDEDRIEEVRDDNNGSLIFPQDLSSPTEPQINLHARRIPPRVAHRLWQMADVRRSKLLKSRQAVIRVLIAIVATFAVCNLPFHLRKICQYYVRSYDFGSDLSYLVTAFTFLLMYTNCAINPILYAFLSKSFRSSLQDVLRLRVGRRTRYLQRADTQP